jgi:translation initiation factor IF-2
VVNLKAKYRRDKRDTHRQNLMMSKDIDEGSKTIKVTEFVTVGEIAIMMDVPITKVWNLYVTWSWLP